LPKFKFLNFFFWTLFMLDCILLTWLGAQPVAWPYLMLSRICTFYYFFYFVVALPIACRLESSSTNEFYTYSTKR
jgi:ubiquinol-cytochrome c reductase cytochrome b subunit